MENIDINEMYQDWIEFQQESGMRIDWFYWIDFYKDMKGV